MSDAIQTETAPKIETPVKAPKAKKPAKAKAEPTKNGSSAGIRPLQVKVLAALKKANGPLSRPKLYKRLQFSAQSGLNDVLGKNDPKKRAIADKAKYPSLLTLKYVRLIEIDVDGHAERVYEITAAGKKALEKAN